MIAEAAILFLLVLVNLAITLFWRDSIRRMRRDLAALEDRLCNSRRYLDARRTHLDEDCCKN